MNQPTLSELESALLWERMSGERLHRFERDRILNGGKFFAPTLWHTIDTIPQEEMLMVWLRWDDMEFIASIDSDMDAKGWAAHGVSHWKPVTEREVNNLWEKALQG